MPDFNCTPIDEAEIKWCPIKDAPRDGTPVDLWHKDGYRVAHAYWRKEGYAGYENENWAAGYSNESFSHYSHILAPPGE